MRHRIGASLIQVFACRLFGAKPLPESVMAHCWLDPQEQNSVIFLIEIKTFSLPKLHMKVLFANVSAILSRPQCVNYVYIYIEISIGFLSSMG